MTTERVEPSAERQQTDESLRVEREKVDAALVEHVAAFDEIADAVISRARVRADGVLAAARARSDLKAAAQVGTAARPVVRNRARGREDEILREERANADEVLREERAEHVAILTAEREETDKDLVKERGRSDDELATRDELLGLVSHDLRNLLNSVMGFSALISLAAAKDDTSPELVKNADRIHRAGARMVRLVGDLVDVASIQAGMLAVTREVDDPKSIIMEAVDIFQTQASAARIAVTVEIAASPLVIAFDGARILQVLTNLLSNAIKFTPANGKVVVRLKRRGADACFSVTDTGPGIPQGMLATVFERYVQADQHDRRGVGLGLYISKSIVLGHGGKIWATSTVGKGSSFFFTIPLASPG